MDNLTTITEFLLMDISSSRELQVLQGLLFSLIYLGTLAGNLVTIAVIVTDTCLPPPMYFSKCNLSLIDICSISVVFPKSIVNSLMGSKTISLTGCAAQVYLYSFLAFAELAFLVFMSYDRYVAICHPLHYRLSITTCVCSQAAGGSWGSGLVYSATHTGNLFRLPFTKSNVINQYFCDVPQIMRISSLDVQYSQSVMFVISACIVLVCLSFLVISYVNIFSAAFKIRSVEARKKALSTCTPQLVILLLFSFSGLIAVLGPIANKASLENLLTAVFYTMVPPFLNPIIYSLRNRQVNTALRKMYKSYFEKTHNNSLQ
ncbi:olfactory receptor 14I1-like [Manis pentadactyla]|uniref:olfactory receptor 14I1-like n=1 Tax=Manis pentadactyla TaxID=143292 RepID=UPI00255C2C8D|nr:olfactory receptor 14I1-like [Manis pentadactyla]